MVDVRFRWETFKPEVLATSFFVPVHPRLFLSQKFHHHDWPESAPETKTFTGQAVAASGSKATLATGPIGHLCSSGIQV